MTSLQRQLTTLRATRTNELDLKAQWTTYSKSLLFDPAVAANQSIDTLFQICHEGYQELCALDSRFLSYQKSLFSPHSKTQDRHVMTAKENQDLDTVLHSFLALAGGRLQLKPAQKAVEWLIRRFRINDFNTEPLVLTFLPYHTTSIFTAVLSVLPTNLPPSLKFLNRYVNAVQNPPRDAFVQATVQYPGFFTALNQHVLQATKMSMHHHLLLSLWASVMVQSIHTILNTSVTAHHALQQQRQEELYTRLLPVLNKGLGLKRAPELVLGCYMIIIVLVGKADLSDETLKSLMKAVCRSWTLDTSLAGLSCLAHVAQQLVSRSIPKSVASAVLQIDGLAQALDSMVEQQPIEALFLGLVDSTTKSDHLTQIEVLLGLTRLAIHRRLLSPSGESYFSRRLSSWTAAILKAEHLDRAQVQQVHDIQRQLTNAEEVVSQPREQLAPTVKDGVALLENEDGRAIAHSSTEDGPEIAARIEEIHIPSNLTSFLTESHAVSFTPVLDVFEQAARSQNGPKTVLDSTMFSDQSARSHRVTTFLVRVWCTSKSILARASALAVCGIFIESNVLEGHSIAFVLPYVMAALADESRKVRSNAAHVLMKLAPLMAKASANHREDTVMDLNRYYGINDPAHTSATRKDYTRIIAALTNAGLEECIADRSQVGQVLKDLFGSVGLKGSATKQGEKMKSADKDRLYGSWTSHMSMLGSRATRYALLKLMTKVTKVAGNLRSQYMLPLIRDHAATYEVDAIAIRSENLALADYDTEMLNIVHAGDGEALKFLLGLSAGTLHTSADQLRSAAFTRLQSIWPLVARPTQTALAMSLLHSARPARTDHLSQLQQEQSESLLRSLPTAINDLKGFLEGCLAEVAELEHPPKKQRLTSGNASVSGHAETSNHLVAKMTLIMELVDSSAHKANAELFHCVFRTLPELQSLSTSVHSDLSYLTALALGFLASTMDDLNNHKSPLHVDASVVRADLLVDCIRTTSSSQARNSALLLLSLLVKQMPQLVLQSVMPIFTMMSSTTMRQNDDFSAHVVHQAIHTIVPVLALKLQEQRKDLISSTADILLNFAAAFQHIPPHRRLQLFSLLASSLGPEPSLFAILATLVDHSGALDQSTEFAHALLDQFSADISMKTIEKYIGFVADGSMPNPKLFSLLGKQELTTAEKEAALVSHLSVIVVLLQGSAFRTKVRRDLKDKILNGAIRGAFVKSFERAVAISQTSQATLHRAANEVLESLLATFPFDILATTVEPLFSHPDQALARTVLRTIEQRLRLMKQSGSDTRQAMVGLLPQLTTILTATDKAIVKPAALACLDCICEKFGKSDPSATLKAMEAVAGSHCLLSENRVLQTLSLQCLASSIEVLGNDFIPLMHQTVEAASLSVIVSIDSSTTSEQLHNASFAFFSALQDHLSFMVSKPLMVKILNSSLASAMASLEPTGHGARTQCLQLTSFKVDISAVIQALDSTWDKAVESGSKPLQELITLLQSTLENTSKATVARNVRDISALFLKMFDLRRTAKLYAFLFPPTRLQELEASLSQILVAFVLKINDSMFRPFFTQLIDWAAAFGGKDDTEGRELRLTTLFILVRSLSERLRSIFTSYFNNFLEVAVETLRSPTSASLAQMDLKSAVVSALTSSFKHDQDDFWQAPARFDAVVGPLLAELSSSKKADLVEFVIPSVTELASAAASSENHKKMNGLLLKQFRADSARTRLAAVKCQTSLSQRLGDDWLGNLPEMLPFISELQEDDDEKVEQETHKWIKIIEGILGESLNDMLQ